MKALVFSGNPAQPVEFADVLDPVPAPDQALVAVEAFSINRGDGFAMNGTYGSLPAAGSVRGQDVAGTVLRAAADGSGPTAGTRVVGKAAGGWAERVVISTSALATLPETVDVIAAAALPLAGLTAVRLRRAAGELTGQRLLITGAGGGVGHYLVELATAAGAIVTAVTSDPRAAEQLRRLGAHEVVSASEHTTGPFGVVMESIGGQEFSNAAARLAPGGLILWFGQASRQPITLDFFSFLTAGTGFTLRHFAHFVSDHTDAEDLATLVALMNTGRLHPQIGRTADWTDTPSVLADLMSRRIPGKAVLRITAEPC
ncbi:zinc-binding dehydrogenase [Nocardia sp. NPDC059240]|uniref:zinc-binding dehydrogenase n=1 Tax=Nocardia sp. NPDC059240 TaxID=3346786 RepID=UPI0036D0C3D7